MTPSELLREKAREYELNALAAEERGDIAATDFTAIAITLYEVAKALEEVRAAA